MSQISPAADKKLNEYSRKIGDAEERRAAAQTDFDATWAAVVEVFSEFDKRGIKFLADDGYTIHDQRRAGTPRLDKEKLEELLITRLGERKGKQMWNQITVVTRTVDMGLLEAMSRTGKIPADLVDECITVGEDTFARVRRKFTKEDINEARALGIVVDGVKTNA